MSAYDALLQPIQIGPKTAPNRFAINAMEHCDSDERGNPSERTYERYRRLFEGGAGLIDLEAITVSYESRSRLTAVGDAAQPAGAGEIHCRDEEGQSRSCLCMAVDPFR